VVGPDHRLSAVSSQTARAGGRRCAHEHRPARSLGPLNGGRANFSSERLMRLLTTLGQHAEIRVRAKPRTRARIRACPTTLGPRPGSRFRARSNAPPRAAQSPRSIAFSTSLAARQDRAALAPDRPARLLHGHALPPRACTPAGERAGPRALGLGDQRPRLGARRDPRDPARDDLWHSHRGVRRGSAVPRRRAGAAPHRPTLPPDPTDRAVLRPSGNFAAKILSGVPLPTIEGGWTVV
jgi:hypothetical protein